MIKYLLQVSFSADVFSFCLIDDEYFSPDDHKIVRGTNQRHERPVISFIPDKSKRSLLEFCVEDDPMSRPSFDFICSFIFMKFVKDTPRRSGLEKLTQIPRIDEDKLVYLRVLASRESMEVVEEYECHIISKDRTQTQCMSFSLKGANGGDVFCQSTLDIPTVAGIAD